MISTVPQVAEQFSDAEEEGRQLTWVVHLFVVIWERIYIGRGHGGDEEEVRELFNWGWIAPPVIWLDSEMQRCEVSGNTSGSSKMALFCTKVVYPTQRCGVWLRLERSV